jgi:hypothetical protein
MNKIQTDAPRGVKTRWCVFNQADDAAIKRLLVLLPSQDLDEAALANILWVLARKDNARARLLCLLSDWSDEPQMRLRAALVCALLRESGIEAEAEYAQGADWLRETQTRRLPGDVVVCHAEQTIADGANAFSVQFKPISQFFIAQRIPVCEVSGVVRGKPQSRLSQLRSLALPALIIVLTLVAQVIFTRLTTSWALWARNLSLGVSSAVELVSIAWLATPRGD